MTDFSIRSDQVDVEQIMRQIRARIREKRGVDYTEEEVRELANVKLETFLDPRGVRSDLLQEYRRVQQREPLPPPPNYLFEESTLFHSHRAPIRWIRALLKPILKLFFNPNPLIQALHIQSQLNTRWAEREAQLDADAQRLGSLQYELTHNLVVELTRLNIEVKNLKMRLESMSSRLDFDERRARALEGVVQYRPGAVPPLQPPAPQDQPSAAGMGDPAERRTRRRRRRGRKRSGGARPEFGSETRATDAAQHTSAANHEPAAVDRESGGDDDSGHDEAVREPSREPEGGAGPTNLS